VLIANGKVAGILGVEEPIAGHSECNSVWIELAPVRGQSPALARAFLRAYETHVALDESYDSLDLSRIWIRSLIRYGDRYARGLASQSHRTAREHVLSLTTDR